MQTDEIMLYQENARSVVYRRLADLFRPPGPELPGVLEELESALGRLDSAALEAASRLTRSYFEHSDSCSLKVDHASLFVGPFTVPAPPYGSVYLENNRQLMGDTTVAVQRYYREFGLDLSPDFKEAPDHICAELEFMHVLVVKELEAIDAADYRQLSKIVRHQRLFLENHPGAWMPAFSARITAHARNRFYGHLAEVARFFVAEELEVLPDLPVGAVPASQEFS
jgi:TorA maturation chaperone TorD